MADYGGTSYYGGGGSGGGGGGGYMTNSQSYGSQGSPGSSRRQPQASLRPVTIRQIREASQAHSDAEFLIDDLEAGQVTFVAQVISSVAQATNIVCSVTDGSGQVEVRQWLDSAEDGERKKEGIPDMSWVRVLGTIKSHNSRRHVTANRILPITDMHEIFYHQLDALNAHLHYTRGPLTDGGAPSNVATGVPSEYSAGRSVSHGDGGSDQIPDMPPLSRKIYIYMKNTPIDDDGMGVAEIAQGVKSPGLDAEQISEAIDWLADNGHIFAAADDDHFRIM